MISADLNRFIEIVLHILNKSGGTDAYHLFKILYFAEMSHISDWGVSFIPDEFKARTNGPVPELLYASICQQSKPTTDFAKSLWGAIESAQEDAKSILLPKRHADYDFISPSELEALDKSIDENINLSFEALRNKSHDHAWEKAYNSHDSHIISALDMAQVCTVNEGMAEYIKDQLAINKMLQ